jgi:hypothetical protein
MNDFSQKKYYVYNPKTIRYQESEGRPNQIELEYFQSKGFIVFYDLIEVTYRMKDDQRELDKMISQSKSNVTEYTSWHDELSSLDLSDFGNNDSVENNEIECFEKLVNQTSELVNQTPELVNQISKSKRGGKRDGAGSKKGISKSNDHKEKISKSMLGKQNAKK